MKRADQQGFTLLEVLLAVAITAMVMVTVSSAFLATLRARETVASLSESTAAGPRILTLMERDLRGLWHQNINDNRILVGQNLDVASFDADRIDFLTSTDPVGVLIDQFDLPQRPTISEVGYWLRDNREIPGLMELWRREDPMVDDELLEGGTFQMVHDRIKSFSIKYYETTGFEAEEFLEWDSSRDDKLPRRIEIEFTVERELSSRNVVSDAELEDFEGVLKTYKRNIVLDRRYSEILQPGIAMVPIVPTMPQAGGPEGPIGPAGPADAGPQGALGPAGGPGGGGAGTGTGAGSVRGGAGGNLPAGSGRSQSINLGDLLRPGAGRGGGVVLPTGGRGGR